MNRSQNTRTIVCSLSFAFAALSFSLLIEPGFAQEQTSVASAKLGETKNVHVIGDIYTAGQFNPSDLASIKSAGIKHVITLRRDKELKWNEQKIVEEAGLKYSSIPFAGPDTMTDEILDKVCVQLKTKDGITLLHCGSATRVGAVWIAHRVLNDEVSLEQAKKEAKEIGLSVPAYEAKAIAYVEQKLTERKNNPSTASTASDEKSVRPGINDGFLDPDLNPEEWIKRFEIESREIFNGRKEILASCGITSGNTIADIGAGTGLFTRMFAEKTGTLGWVFAVDISPRMIGHINNQSSKLKQKNVTAVLCQQDSVNLPPASVDLAFICDTYHHFEYPKSTMASLHSALKPGATLIVIDFNRIPGKSREWTINHVRAGKEVFQSEIESAGFELVEEKQLNGLSENYFLKFRKKAN
ncbi:MAG: methyltransferase domain-containing protein [Mariniblastus sp.]